MKTQSAQFAEVFCQLRDHAVPYSKQDAADLAKVRTFSGPSKAELKRIARKMRGEKFRQPPKPDVGVSEAAIAAKRANDWFAGQMLMARSVPQAPVPIKPLMTYNGNTKKFLLVKHEPVYVGGHEVQPTPAEKLERERLFAERVAVRDAERVAKAIAGREAAWRAYADSLVGCDLPLVSGDI